MSLASVANNHTCISTAANGGGGGTNGNGNGTVIIDLSKERSDNIRLHNYRNKTIPAARNSYHYQNHHQNGDGILVGAGGGTGSNGNNVSVVIGGGAGQQNGKYYRNRRVSSPTGPNPS